VNAAVAGVWARHGSGVDVAARSAASERRQEVSVPRKRGERRDNIVGTLETVSGRSAG
jgi:hypothetical protein